MMDLDVSGKDTHFCMLKPGGEHAAEGAVVTGGKGFCNLIAVGPRPSVADTHPRPSTVGQLAQALLIPLCLILLLCASAFGQTHAIYAFAGGGLPNGVPATSLRLPGGVIGVAVDGAGNTYIAGYDWGVVFRVDAATGEMTVFAGGGTQADLAYNGPATSAQLVQPSAVTVDAVGNVYITDVGPNVVRKVSNGLITTVAGNGTSGYSGDNGPATSAKLYQPYGIAVDAAGHVYIADCFNKVIREVSNGVITTFAGNGTYGYSGDNGPATSAQLDGPSGVAVDASGNVYIADSGNNRIRKVANGVITTFAGNGTQGYSGDNGLAANAELYAPEGVGVDAAGTVYIADSYNNVVRKVSDGVITTVAGTGAWGYSGDNGPATRGQMNTPWSVAADSSGNVYIADLGNGRLRKVSNGVITTIAGGGDALGNNGPPTSAKLFRPLGVAADPAGNVYIADASSGNATNNLIWKVSSGLITAFAGTGSWGSSGDNGPATEAELSEPYGVAVDASGNVYIADSDNNRIRRVSNGVITTIAGNGTMGWAGDYGPATAAQFSFPTGVAVDASGNVYVADLWNCAIRMVSNGVITTFAGGNGGYWGDNGPATGAAFLDPNGVAVDASGNVYIADTGNGVVRVVVQTLAAQGASLGAAASTGSIQVNVPAGVPWTAVSCESWITITSGTSGTGSGTVIFSLQPNTTGYPRFGGINIGELTYTIQQGGDSAVSFAGSMPQIASAGGWDTSLTLVNLGTSEGDARLNFYANDGSAPWLPFTFPKMPQIGTLLGATFDYFYQSFPSYATVLLDTTGPTSQSAVGGSAQLFTGGNIDGFAIFKYAPTGQQAVVPLEVRNASSYLLAFDYTNGIQTGFALANVSAAKGNVNVVVRDDTGAVIPTRVTSIPLTAGNGHTSFILNDATQGFPEIAGKRGTVEFDTPSGGQISVLGLRVNGKAITTLPVLAQVGTTGGALAQVAVGGGWETGFTLVNTGTAAAKFTLSFYDEKTGMALPLSLVFPQGGLAQTTAAMTQTLAPGATLQIQTQGDNTAVACSAQLTTTGQVSGFAIFEYVPSAQEAVVPLETRTPKSFVLAYDNTNGLATGVALANLSAQAALVQVVVRDDTGATLAQNQIQLVGNGHTQFMLDDSAQGFPITAGRRGTVEFQTPSGGRISALGIRAVTATNVITTIPVLAKQQ
ncbi:MAG: hypothetical protein P4L40_03725 [Terracidiphilus sp.]|nr:hypothetical protein [Terracidiphilus sp.]